MSNSNGELLIKTKIWLRESIELIDYQNNETIDNIFGTKTSGAVCRDGQLVYILEGDKMFQTNNKDLIKFERNNITGKYIINCGTWSKDLKKLVEESGIFMVYKGSLLKDYNDMKSKHYYKLSQGDIIKLGRIYLKVLDINIKKESEIKESKKNNKIKSKYKGTMIHSSSSNCMFINGQQIIKGAFSPNFSQNKKYSQILFNKNELNFSNSLLTSRHKNQINEQDSINIDLFTQKKLFALPRINSHNDLFFIRKISSKNKKLKDVDIIIKKPLYLPKNRPACRICYGENNNNENPLICPCICKGSMKYIHYLCLRNWLNSKIEEELSDESTDKDNMECVTYNKSCICCELCKTKFPDYIVHNNTYYNILFYKPKFKEFIIFQSMRVGKDKTTYYHVVNLDDKDFINIGRANECELSLPELSVSRFHCIIHKDNGQLFLEDNTSKFGSLILVQNKNMIVNDLMPLKLQVNKTYIKFKLNLPFSLSLFCCGRQNTIEGRKFDYHEQNKKGFDILSFLEVKDDNNIWGRDDENDEETKSNNIDNNNNNKNKKEKENKKEELIDDIKEEENNNNNNIFKNNFETEKNSININNKESLIDKSINEEKNKNNKEELVEIESEIKNEVIKENKELNKKETNKKNETKRIKKISIRKGKNDMKLDKINLSNIKDNNSVSLISGNKNKMKIENLKNKQSNTVKFLSNSEQSDSDLINKNSINIFNPALVDQFGNIKDNINEKKGE